MYICAETGIFQGKNMGAGALTPSVGKSSTTVAFITTNVRVLVFQGEFQLLSIFQCWQIKEESEYMFTLVK